MGAATPLTGRVIWSGDRGYRAARTVFNTRFEKYPLGIVYCRRDEDVANAVRWAREKGVPLRVRSGGHSYEAFSVADGALIIDVSPLDGVFVDREEGLALIGAGARLLPVYRALARHGVTIPAGTCPTVGIGGLTLGGGFGMRSRQAGLTCDSLAALTMIDADGCRLCADEDRHPDLFWASRGGGGGNFGIVTAFAFRVQPNRCVAYLTATWPWRDAAAVLDAWQVWAPFTDRRLTTTLAISAAAADRVTVQGEFAGPPEELRQLITPLLAAARPTGFVIETLPFMEAVLRSAGLLAPGGQPQSAGGPHPFNNTGAYAYQALPAAAIDTILAFLAAAPNRKSQLELQALGGAVADIPPDATAYIHRQAPFNLQYITGWQDKEEEETNIVWAENFRRALLPYTIGTYVNWPDQCIKNWPQAYYGGNFPRLTTVKAAYDPDDVFLSRKVFRSRPLPLASRPPLSYNEGGGIGDDEELAGFSRRDGGRHGHRLGRLCLFSRRTPRSGSFPHPCRPCSRRSTRRHIRCPARP